MRHRASLAAGVVAVLVSGCGGFVATDVVPGAREDEPLRRSGAAFAPRAAAFSAALAGADGDESVEIQDVYLPALSSWPRSLRAKGPVYALVQVNPFVGQFGVLADYERADTGFGFGIVGGYRKPMSGAKALALEGIFERSSHTNESSDVDATATRLIAAARLNMKMDEKLTPFVVAGGGRYKLEFDGLDSRFNLSGLGVMFGGGIDYAPKTNFSVRAEMNLHIWDAAEEGSGGGGMAETLTLGFGAAVSF